MARSKGDTAMQAHALMRMGNLRAEEGDFVRSIEELEQACAIFEQMNHLAGLSTALNALGATYDDVGRWQDAISCYGRSLEISNTIGDVRLSARASNNMALTLVGRGELQRARELLEHSSEQFRRIGSELEVADFTPNLAEVLLLQGYPQQALPIFHESIEIMERLNARLGLPEVLRLAAEASLEIGDFEQATTYAQDAIRVASEIGIAVKHANARRVLGQIAMSQRDFATARAELEQSRTELEQLGNRYELGKVLYWQARLAAMQEAHDEMLAVARAAYEIFDELGAQHDLKLVAQLIPDLERGSEQGEQARQEVR
jgi:tetratricopeptide (TPR) repeat protein